MFLGLRPYCVHTTFGFAFLHDRRGFSGGEGHVQSLDWGRGEVRNRVHGVVPLEYFVFISSLKMGVGGVGIEGQMSGLSAALTLLRSLSREV